MVLMFCGPHASREWSPLYHRIDAAIEVSLDTGLPLIVAGDDHEGQAVEHFACRAAGRGASVRTAFDPEGRTVTDVRAALAYLRDTSEAAAVDRLLVVTDDWHVRRCLVMLERERERLLPGRHMRLVDRSTSRGPRPPSWVLEGERRGIDDYLADRPYRPFGEPFGKIRRA